jgi:hypothetical protein
MFGLRIPRNLLCNLGRFSPGAMQFFHEATCATLPQAEDQRATCFAIMYRQLSVVQCCNLSRMLTAAASLHTACTDSGWIRTTRIHPGPPGGSALRMLALQRLRLAVVVLC